MSKIILVLVTLVLGLGVTHAQDSEANQDRAGRWVKGHWLHRNHHRTWVRGHWTTSEQAREEYKDVQVPNDSQIVVGKFIDDNWQWEDGRVVYVRKHFAPVAPQDSNFSAAALNARQVELLE